MVVSPEHFAAARAAVEASFPVQEVWFQNGRPAFTIVPGPDDKARFLELRERLRGLGVLPMMRRHQGETVILLASSPPAAPTAWRWPVLLFIATLATTFVAGYLDARGACVPGLLAPVPGGIAFALSLMAILFCHEMGHKVVSIWRGIDASLPYFIPMPPLPGLAIGTLGAVIFTRTPAPNRDALIELGASGPLAGFVVAIPILFYGVLHSLVIPHAAIVARGCALVAVPTPLLVDLLIGRLLHPAANADVIIHPMAFAGWVGLLVTALNLLPASMLDGGHVTRAALGPRWHLILSYIAVAVGIVFGYWLMSVLVLFMIRRGHPGPLDDCSAVSPAHIAVAVSLIPVFVLSAVRLGLF
ncbi:MAG TPA: site-2 protease family protein [bacterium]|jgi:Zn-dependent protease|nr:site-2 protease family protein [bacterium]